MVMFGGCFISAPEAPAPRPQAHGAEGTHPAAKGRAPPEAGAGRGRPGERSPGPPDRAGAERRAGEPQGRADPGPQPPQQN